ncbi:MAG: RNA polymerase sigma factor [Pseudobutyrivibrio sp.]|nr:RNA polymerase sigma factor [Pseudobutyrivibrio sp.]
MEKINPKDKIVELVTKYQNLVFSICLKLTGDYFVAEDISQDTFLTAFEKLDSFDGNNEKAWISRIASNKCIDYLKAAERRSCPVGEEDMPEQAAPDSNEPLQKYLNSEVLQELEEKCNNLPEPYRRVAVEHFLRGHTPREIADSGGKSIKTIQTQIYRARDMLRQSIRKEDLLG